MVKPPPGRHRVGQSGRGHVRAGRVGHGAALGLQRPRSCRLCAAPRPATEPASWLCAATQCSPLLLIQLLPAVLHAVHPAAAAAAPPPVRPGAKRRQSSRPAARQTDQPPPRLHHTIAPKMRHLVAGAAAGLRCGGRRRDPRAAKISGPAGGAAAVRRFARCLASLCRRAACCSTVCTHMAQQGRAGCVPHPSCPRPGRCAAAHRRPCRRQSAWVAGGRWPPWRSPAPHTPGRGAPISPQAPNPRDCLGQAGRLCGRRRHARGARAIAAAAAAHLAGGLARGAIAPALQQGEENERHVSTGGAGVAG